MNTHTTIGATLNLYQREYQISLNLTEWTTVAGVAGALTLIKDNVREDHIIGLYKKSNKWMEYMRNDRRKKSKNFSCGPHILIFQDKNIHSIYIGNTEVRRWKNLRKTGSLTFSAMYYENGFLEGKILLTHKE